VNIDTKRQQPEAEGGTIRIVAIGSGAGAGYLLGGLLAVTLLSPVAIEAVAVVGASEGMSGGFTTVVEIVSALTGAYGGARLANNLIEG
jgi:hypothetical protein